MRSDGWIRQTVLGMLALSGIALPLHAQVNCGDSITGPAVMTADLVCGANNPALTVDGGSLDMAGHRLSGCLGDGIVVTGKGAELRNGTVDGCAIGVRVEGTGEHEVEAVVASDGSLDGFFVSSGNNKLLNTSAVGNLARGYTVSSVSNGNKLLGNTAANNFTDGFSVSGSGNKLTDNFASSNGGLGFVVTGSGNKLSRNLAESNSGANISVTGNDNTLARNHAIRSTFDVGVAVTGNRNKLSRNTVANSGNGNDSGFLISGNENGLVENASIFNTDHGFELSGNDNLLSGCRAVDNTGSGIQITAGSGNSVKKSHAAKNTGSGIRLRVGAVSSAVSKNVTLENAGFDLEDDNTDCDQNTWKDNVSSTVDPLVCVD